MKRTSLLLLIFVLFAATACQPVALQNEVPSGSTAESAHVDQGELLATIQTILDEWRSEHDVVGVTLAVASPGHEMIEVASGLANPDESIAMQPTHPMYVGSVTKTLIAATTLQLIHEGQLALDDSLSQWFPAYPNAEAITVAQLLNMTSGTFDYFRATPDNPFIGMLMEDITKVWTPDEIIAVAAALEPAAEPGEIYWYSNTNYLMLGRIIEAVTGNPLAAELRTRFYEPLGLNDSYMAGDEPLPDNLASGYVRDFAFLFGAPEATAVHPAQYAGMQTVFWAAGGLVSTSSDLAIWAQSLFGGDLIDADLYAQMITPNGFVDEEEKSYGYGVEFYETAIGSAVGHPGSIPGYASLTLYAPEHDIAIAAITNDNEHGEAQLAALLDEVLRVMGENR